MQGSDKPWLGETVNQRFEENGQVLAEISDTHLIVHNKGPQPITYRLDSLTGASDVFSHESEPKHVVVFGTSEAPGQTVGVVWSTLQDAKAFQGAVTSAVVNP